MKLVLPNNIFLTVRDTIGVFDLYIGHRFFLATFKSMVLSLVGDPKNIVICTDTFNT